VSRHGGQEVHPRSTSRGSEYHNKNLIKDNVIARRPASTRAKAAQPAAHPRGPEDRAAHARRGARGQAPSFK
jgi:hypothetical protein